MKSLFPRSEPRLNYLQLKMLSVNKSAFFTLYSSTRPLKVMRICVFFFNNLRKKQLQLVWFVNLTKPENMGLFLFTFKHQRLHFLFCSFFSWLSPKPVFFGLFSSTICLILKVDFSHFNISLTNINYSFYVLVSR